MTKTKIAVIGGGLAGCEAAWQLARQGLEVSLFEMRPQQGTPAHRTGDLAELVCSNSFKSTDLGNAHGLLKAELEAAGSLLMVAAKKASVPAGAALAVDRELFSQEVKQGLEALETLTLCQQEVLDPWELLADFDQVLVATGPLTSKAMSQRLVQRLGQDQLYFYDAIAPVVELESIDQSIAWFASRYDKGDAAYLNCPLNEQEYFAFVEALVQAKKVPFKDFEQARHFEGCLPIEVLAECGPQTLAFGPFKPVGLPDPRTGQICHAVLQLRQENSSGSLFNLVGCQTRMTYGEQERVFRMIPGLQRAEFARLGSMHRNTFINAPLHLNPDLSLKIEPRIFLAGQITGVEGYSESTAMGLWAALCLLARLQGMPGPAADGTSMHGALVRYLGEASAQNFQPMNCNFGLLKPLQGFNKLPKRDKKAMQAEQALAAWKGQIQALGLG